MMPTALLALAVLLAGPDGGTAAPPVKRPAAPSAKIAACSKALDGTPKLTEVVAKCAPHYSGVAKGAWEMVLKLPNELQAVVLAQGIAREYCPLLGADRPEACDEKEADQTQAVVSALNPLNTAALKLTLGETDGAVLGRKMADAWKYLFRYPTGKLPN